MEGGLDVAVAEEGAGPPRTPSPQQETRHDWRTVYVARHGERIDETPAGDEWRLGVEKSRRFDPPLTAAGASQAKALGQFLKTKGFTRIWTSPLARCVATANELANALDVPVTVVPGLGSCAAAVAKAGVANVNLLSFPAMQHLCPRIDSFDTTAPRDFYGACRHVLTQSTDLILLVSHREGINELAAGRGRGLPDDDDLPSRRRLKHRTRRRLHLPYCATARFFVTNDGSHWDLHSLAAPPV